MGECPRSPRLLGVVTRRFDQSVEACDGVLDHRRQIFREGSARTGLQPQVRSIQKQDTGPSVGGVSTLEVAQDALDFAFLGNRHGHVQTQPDNTAIEFWHGQQSAQLVEVTALDIDPLPKRDPFCLQARPPRPMPE